MLQQFYISHIESHPGIFIVGVKRFCFPKDFSGTKWYLPYQGKAIGGELFGFGCVSDRPQVISHGGAGGGEFRNPLLSTCCPVEDLLWGVMSFFFSRNFSSTKWYLPSQVKAREGGLFEFGFGSVSDHPQISLYGEVGGSGPPSSLHAGLCFVVVDPPLSPLPSAFTTSPPIPPSSISIRYDRGGKSRLTIENET